MSVTVAPTGRLGRSVTGVAYLIAESATFQDECGNAGDKVTTLNDFVFFPNHPDILDDETKGKQYLRAPMALVTIDPGNVLVKPVNGLGEAEVFVQISLIEDSATYPGSPQDRWTDACNRFDMIMNEIVEKGKDRTGAHNWLPLESYQMEQPPELQNADKFDFKDAGDNEVDVRTFALIFSLKDH